jgi:hypothetical protein
MQLIHDLERLLAAEESLFRQQLLREDIARLRRLEALAGSAPDLPAFVHAAMSLVEAVYRRDEARIAEAWNELHRARMERLLGCLATPVPKPVE